ncbi:ABC transporter substrate-binding protein [Extibacter muris]|uniref:ABC transporter substrate-binding protein n=1 Tax=Extibacter muris TaxID=1796622 RepID=UPI001D07B242|nr:ABC transporter substrate-binding protein [Extibacter muris]MCB6202079.1 ABC transporter substrate-binding protein [Extibacter muris]MCQ4665704.1 ABC transporter substrate-binding protein [Extibacter muris]MCQ4693148.1 ABC transporter substrate-binding protein [Extibacter muris]
MKKGISFLLILAMCATMLSACSGGKEASGDSEKSKGGSNKDKIVRIMFSNTPYLDPAVGSDEASTAAFPNIYDSLVVPTHDGDTEPSLATEWTVSEDGLTWVFKLRDDVKFHNGEPLKASDVVFTMNRLLTIGEGFAYLFQGKVKEAAALDDYQVQFTLSEPFGPFLSTLVRLYIVSEKEVMENLSEGNYGEFKDYGKAYLNEHDAGSGAYQVTEYVSGSHVAGTKFDGYFNKMEEGSPEKFKFMVSPESVTVKTMMSRQEVEITDMFQPMEAFAEMDKMDGISVMKFFGGSMMYLTMNNKKAPTDDIHFRKAMAYLADRANMVESIFPGSKVANGPVTEVLAGALDEKLTYDYSLEQAEEELKMSKYYDQLDELDYTIYWVAETPDREKLALLIQSDAAKIGLNVNVEKVPWLTFVESAASPEQSPNSGTILTTPSYSEAGSQLVASYLTKEIGSWESLDWYSNDKVDTVIKDAISTIDRDERLGKYEEAQRLIMEDYATVPLFELVETHAYQSGYLYWEAADRAEKGESVVPVMGYQYSLKGMRFLDE